MVLSAGNTRRIVKQSSIRIFESIAWSEVWNVYRVSPTRGMTSCGPPLIETRVHVASTVHRVLCGDVLPKNDHGPVTELKLTTAAEVGIGTENYQAPCGKGRKRESGVVGHNSWRSPWRLARKGRI